MLAKKQSKAIEPSDGEVISCGMTAAQAVIDRHVKAEKANYPDLPEPSIRMMTMRGANCVCAVAQYLLSRENKP